MNKQRCAQIENEFLRHMVEKSLLARLKRTRTVILHLIDAGALAEQIYSMKQGKRAEPGMVLVICHGVMENLSAAPEEGWLKAIYSYLKSRMYPETWTVEYDGAREAAYLFYIRALEFFLKIEPECVAFDHFTDFAFLTEQERHNAAFVKEYDQFMLQIEQSHVYALLRIARIATRIDLLAHTAGVHHIAMHVARSLKEAGVPVDLALVSAAAAGHDFGKLGCRLSEERRTPYLHYYYTDQWFERNAMPAIDHIAANHSTWDLELENLPVESLILIYADFRVKRLESETVQEIMHVYSLEEAFDIILNKLDNVDDAKRRRYRYVYAKLKDFESYIYAWGVKEDLSDDSLNRKKNVMTALLGVNEAVEHWKYAAIDHNIRLLNKLSGEVSFGNVLEAARSEKDWKNTRSYLNIFEEYYSYMTQRQKQMTLSFLYELLMHSEGDIQRQAATLMGSLIVSYDVEYRKEIPMDVKRTPESETSLSLWRSYFESMLYPDHKITDMHKYYIRDMLKHVLSTILAKCKSEHKSEYAGVFLERFSNAQLEDEPVFTLLDTVLIMPLDLCSASDIERIMGFIESIASRDSLEIKAGILRLMRYFFTFIDPVHPCLHLADSILDRMDLNGNVSLVFLKYEIYKLRNASPQMLAELRGRIEDGGKTISAIFLENMKAATPWVIKDVNIGLMLRLLHRGNDAQGLHVATHLSNLVKVSEMVVVRHRAGTALVQLAPFLPLDQRNEIAIELAKGLETGQYEFSKYIPEYLGEFSLYLHPQELDEFINELTKFIKGGNDRAAAVALDTIGIMVQAYPKYKARFLEDDQVYLQRQKRLLGLVMCGLAHYHEPVSREAFLVMARQIFASERLTFEEKKHIFSIVNKKMLTLLSEDQGSELLFFNHAASLNHIYRFITDCAMRYGEFSFKESRKVAYFPGTFDPFSLGHKGIVREIRSLNFDVYLALDEFSWSKKTQPRMIRRKIVNMSVADEFGVYLFPDDEPVNLSNLSDLKRLKQLFKPIAPYVVVGSDVILNASSYVVKPERGSVHHFNHIIFKRDTQENEEQQRENDHLIAERVPGDRISLELPTYLEDVSSSRIRENIDLNRDISNLIDPVAQKFIYDNSLYLREPQYKPVLYADTIRFEVHTSVPEAVIASLAPVFSRGVPPNIANTLRRKDTKLIISYDGDNKKPIGFLSFYPISTADLYDEFKSSELANYVRNNTSGKMVVITALAATELPSAEEDCQLLLTEALAACLKEDYTYAIYADARGTLTPHVLAVLQRQGFIKTPVGHGASQVYVADMKFPLVLLRDVDTFIKEPLKSNPRVMRALDEAHYRMQLALTHLYPGNLVLSFHSKVMNTQLMDRITAHNKVPNAPTPVRNLGKCMCVPYGKILRGIAIPNTVTKTLHVEKVYDSEARNFRVTNYPFYSPLMTQIQTIKSFERPVILVDDLLHKGYRIRELDPLFKQAELNIEKLIVGVLSARGKDLMSIQNREVESVYFLPNVRMWFSEANLYPFIGGDSADNSSVDNLGIISSLTLTLPYVVPRFIKGCDFETLLDLSMVCLNNSLEVLLALEKAYREQFERNLTLNRLGEVLISPRRIDKGNCMVYDGTLAASTYLKNDIKQLSRLDRRPKKE
ncbi:MAG: hypothetical protein AAGU74_02965 [Bacillota bacterium]